MKYFRVKVWWAVFVVLLLCQASSALAGRDQIAVMSWGADNTDLRIGLYDVPAGVMPLPYPADELDLSASAGINAVSAGDTNGAGPDELAVLEVKSYGYNALSIYTLDASSNTQFERIASDNYVGRNIESAVLGNFDLDSAKEIALIMRLSTGTFRLMIYNLPTRVSGDVGSALAGDYDIGKGIIAVASGDVDQDGKDELFIVRTGSDGVCSIAVHKSPKTRSGDIGSPVMSYCDIGSGIMPKGICVGDFDNDAKNEIAVVRADSAGGHDLEIYELPSGVGEVAGEPVAGYSGLGEDVLTIAAFGQAEPILPSNQSPHAVLKANPVKGTAPLQVCFDGSGSSDSDGYIGSYSWDLGDGYIASGRTVQHTYLKAGTYKATLTVIDNEGASGAQQITIDVSAGEIADLLPKEQELVTLLNQERQKHNLPALKPVNSLFTAARRHSNDMARNNFFSHTGSDGSSPFTRMRDAGYYYRYAGENVAAGYSTAQAVVTAWMNSSGHRANILNGNFSELGLAYSYDSSSNYDHYWTLDLGSR